jgi:molecular chaperone GrpE
MSKHRKHPPAPPEESTTTTAPDVSEAGAGEPVEDAAVATIAIAGAELSALRQALAAAEERILRLRAEFDNYRRRSLHDSQRQREHAVDRVVLALLPALDDLERVGQSSGADVESLRRGLELVLLKFAAQLEQVDVRAFVSKGEHFNPELHEALTVAEDPAQEDGLVLEEHVRGWQRGGTVIRHAKVVVNKR